MTYAEFRSGPPARQRYWARSHVGWQHLHRADPNDGHRALAALERSGRLTALITQNVDGLHEAAGSRRVVDLHGRISAVICLDCREQSAREAAARAARRGQPRLRRDGLAPGIAPDGDALVGDVESFRVVPCESCGGVLKPDVVFFGENVPRERVDLCYALVEDAEALLVAGSSLTVMSGLRFVRRGAPPRDPDRHRQPGRRPAATSWPRCGSTTVVRRSSPCWPPLPLDVRPSVSEL